MSTITVTATINAELDQVWRTWTNPDDIMQWNFASDDWCCPDAQIDLSEGGAFCFRMESVDGNIGFDLRGSYQSIKEGAQIDYRLEDGRQVWVSFEKDESGTRVTQVFEPETQHSIELQRQGWQAILNNFKQFNEAKREAD